MHRRGFLTFLVGGTAILFGCRRRQQEQTGAGAPNQADPYGSGASSAPPTNTGSYEFIPVWEMHQVPKYPGSEPGELSPLPTQVQNGGTLSFAVPDPAEKVLEFYRTALPALGWERKPSPSGALAAQRGEASLTVVVKQGEHGSTVLLMLTDAV